MKKRIYKMFAVLLWLGLWQAGCYSEKFDPESDEVGPVPTLEFSNPSVQLKAAGESGVVTVATNYKTFRVSVPDEEAAWCHVATEDMDLKISVDENPGGRERSATISISVAKGSKELTKTISVFQAGTLPLVKASRSVVAFQRDEVAAQVVTVETNLDGWEFEQPIGREWFSVTRSGKELTIKTLAASDEKQSRTGYVALQAKDDDREARITLTVVQFGSEPELRLSEEAFSFEANGGTREIEVMTNQPEWELMGGEGEWYTTTVTGNKIVLTVASNPGNPSRDAEIAVFSAKAGLVKNINIAQLGTALSLNLSVDTLCFDASESYGTLQVTTNVGEWDAEVAPGADWCRLMKDANKLTVYAETNTDVTLGRECVVTVTSGELSRAVRVIQAPYMTLQLNHDSLDMKYAGETRAVFVSTNQPEWSFRVPEEMEAWYEVVKEGNELRVTTKAIDARGNVGTIVIAVGKPGMELTTTLTVVQKTSSDRDVLVAFYHATGGDHWTNNTNWCSGKPLSEWYGVTCNEAGRVTRVELRYNKLSGTLPNEIGNLSELEVFDLFGHPDSWTGVVDEGINQLTGNLPVSIGSLQKLRMLNLGCNQFNGTLPSHLGLLKSLERLLLPDNQFSGNIPKELGELDNLIVLELYRNLLEGSIPVELGNLSRLGMLRLSQNRLSGEIPKTFGNLVNLEGLYLDLNQLTGNIPSELGALIKLNDLYLSNNQLDGNIPRELGRMENLGYLYFDDNQLTGDIPVELGNLSKLVILELRFNRLRGEIPGALCDLENLKGLDLENNQLTGDIPKELGNLRKLNDLRLSSNQISGIIPVELGNLTDLVWLRLDNNNLTGNVPKELRNLTRLYRNEYQQGGLTLSGNRLTGVFPAEVKALPNWATFEADAYIFPQQDGYGFEQGSEGENINNTCNVPGEGGTWSLALSSPGTPAVEIPGGCNWIRFASSESSQLVFTVDGNNTGDYRKESVVVRESNGDTRTVGFYQGYADSLYIHADEPGTLRELIGTDRLATTPGMKLSGMLGQDDYDVMKYSMPRLISIDMDEVENTVIPSRAFYGKSAFLHIVLPSRLEVIEDYAFYDCGFKDELKLPETVTGIGYAAFQSCNFTGTLRLPGGLKELDEYAFAQCTRLRGDLVLPDGIEKINRRAFYGNYFDGQLVLPSSLVEIGEEAFSGCESLTGDVAIPYGVTKIGKEAFNYCKKITGLTLPESLEEIGAGAFKYCIKLGGSLLIPSKVKSIGDNVFADCAFTGTLTLPAGLETIGVEAFRACPFTGGLNLPSTISQIGKGAFSSCSGFTGNLVIPDNVKVVEASVFSGCRGFDGTLTLPAGLEEIGNNAFWSCRALSGALVLPASLRTIGENAFSYCDAFTGDLTIPEGVTEIKSNAFSCKSMENTITLPSTLVALGYQAFYGMPGIKYVRCNRAEPLVLSLSPFANASGCVLIVPGGSLEAYKAASKWNEFAEIREE